MPELPEVETVRRGLAPIMEGAVLNGVELRRANLRFAFPEKFVARLTGVHILSLARRGKYMIAVLSTGEALIMHLGMSGRFTIEGKGPNGPGTFVQAQSCNPKHDHVVFDLAMADGAAARVTYNDPRRFGFMDLVNYQTLEESRHFAAMGPEPLSNHFSAATLNAALRGRSAPIKAALLDQSVVAGLGNIYVCEALYRSGISPRRRAANVAGCRGDRLYQAVIAVLTDAIEAGGSSLRDFANSQSGLGYFQHNFDVYDREGEACHECKATISRIVQSGRSTFFCSRCQR